MSCAGWKRSQCQVFRRCEIFSCCECFHGNGKHSLHAWRRLLSNIWLAMSHFYKTTQIKNWRASSSSSFSSSLRPLGPGRARTIGFMALMRDSGVVEALHELAVRWTLSWSDGTPSGFVTLRSAFHELENALVDFQGLTRFEFMVREQVQTEHEATLGPSPSRKFSAGLFIDRPSELAHE